MSVEVIGCGMFSIAFLTMVCLDLYAYQQFRQTRDTQLSSLAEKLSENIRLELNAAFDQLEVLTSVIPGMMPAAGQQPRTVAAAATTANPVSVETEIFKADKAWQCKGVPIAQPYPQFKTMAMIDAKGMQQVKLSSSVWQPAPINVAGREGPSPPSKPAVIGGCRLPTTHRALRRKAPAEATCWSRSGPGLQPSQRRSCRCRPAGLNCRWRR